MPTDLTLEKLRRDDHDALIRVEEAVKSIASDIREMKDGISKQLVDHETRIKRVETVFEIVKPEQSLAEFRDLQLEWRDFKNGAKIVRVFWSVLGGAIVFVLTQLPLISKTISDWFKK